MTTDPLETQVKAGWPVLAGALSPRPQRRLGGVRRTVTVDGHRPDGPEGDVVLTCRGRDLRTLHSGATEVTAAEEVRVVAGVPPDYTIRGLQSSAHEGDLASALVGKSARHGFRRAVRELLARRDPEGSLIRLLLDEIPITTSLSRLALLQSGRMDPPPEVRRSQIGICSGWRVNGVMAKRVLGGASPVMTRGVPSPVSDDADGLAWHLTPALPSFGFRRERLVEVWLAPCGADARAVVDGTFRDTYVDEGGRAMIMHEYSVGATVDPSTSRIIECRATPRVLPGPQCHDAADSATRMGGIALAEVDQVLRNALDPEELCTHLNDHLRALASLTYLVKLLPVSRAPSTEGPA